MSWRVLKAHLNNLQFELAILRAIFVGIEVFKRKSDDFSKVWKQVTGYVKSHIVRGICTKFHYYSSYTFRETEVYAIL